MLDFAIRFILLSVGTSGFRAEGLGFRGKAPYVTKAWHPVPGVSALAARPCPEKGC